MAVPFLPKRFISHRQFRSPCKQRQRHRPSNNSNFIPTFVQSMEGLSSNLNTSNNNFAVTNNTDPNSPPFFALIQCHEDLSRTDCLVCYAVSRTALPICLPRTSGRVFLDGCFLRYDNFSFFHEAVDSATDTKNCTSSLPNNNNWSDFEGGFPEFNKSVVDLVENLTQSAVNYRGFGVMESNGVYGLAQCWESLSNEECRICMNKAKSEAMSCLPSREGRSMNAGCFFRYSTQKFYDNDPQADGGSSGLSSPGAKVAVVLAGVAFLMISSMDEVVEFLTKKGEDREIRVPHQPPFLNARALVSQSQGLSSSTSASRPLTKLGISYNTTSQSSTTPSSEWPLRIDELSSS